jgi:hypothetical protein
MFRKRNWIALVMLCFAFLMGACGGGQKEATEAAIDAAQSAIAAVQAEAAKYVPDQLNAAQASLQSAKDALAKGDYSSALSAAREATNKAKDLAPAAAARKEELTRNWTSLSATIPKDLDTVKGRLDAYSRGAKLPADLGDEQLTDAKTRYDSLKQGWSDAIASFHQGNMVDASQKASSLKDELAKLMEMLGIKS